MANETEKPETEDLSIFNDEFWQRLEVINTQINANQSDEWSNLSVARKKMQQHVWRAPSAEDIKWYLRHFACLEICDADYTVVPALDPNSAKIIQAPNGWLIHDHNVVLRSSPGEMLFKQNKWRLTDEGDDESGSGSITYGTVVQQFVDVAQMMIQVAMQRWLQARIISGYRPMQFAAYLYALGSDYKLDGLQLSKAEERSYAYIKQHIKTKQKEAPEPDRMPR